MLNKKNYVIIIFTGAKSMIFLNKDDFFDIYLNSMLSNYDRDTITNLYQPIIGYEATALYFSLWSLAKQRSLVEIFSHQQLIVTTGMNINKIQEARKKLEAVGLIQTYRKEGKSYSYYIYCMFAPKSPIDFLNDPLFSRLLKGKIGEGLFSKLVLLYKSKPLDNVGYFDISANFPDVFREDLNKVDVKDEIEVDKSTYGRNTKDVSIEFDNSKFIEILETIYHISSSSKVFSKKLLKEISSLSAFYGVNEEAMAEYFRECYHPQNTKNKVDLASLETMCRDDKVYSKIRSNPNGVNSYNFNSEFGKELQRYTELSPTDFLSYKQNGTQPAPADAKVANALLEMGLSTSVTNVIIDYTLKNCANVLSLNYATKIGASIAREGIEDALDAINHLEKFKNKFKKNKDNQSKVSPIDVENDQKIEEKEISDEELERIKDSIEI